MGMVYELDDIEKRAVLTPDTEEEWRVVPMDIHGWAIFDKDNAEIVSNVYSEEIAAQIVADHKAAKSQALLVEALKFSARVIIHSNPAGGVYAPVLQRIRAALKAAGVEEK